VTASLRRILVIDDVPDNVAVLFDFLRSHGFKVLVSESGRHALAELPQMAPDLILLDVMMPELDGFETCRRIKADPRFADVPIFFMTALSETVDKVRGLQTGAVDYITKPIFPEEVLARIAVHLELRDRNRELAEQNERLDAAIQQRVSAERALRESLDRAVIVVDANADVQFIAAAALKLLQRYFADWSGPGLPAEVAQWLMTPAGGVLTISRGTRQLELTRASDVRDGRSRLVYLDEKAPPPSPEMLLPLGLTPREAEILFWVAQGKTSPEIAIIVGNAPATVKKHVENITAKLGVETRLAAALKAMELLGTSAS
jgi:DNA-binding response OmpR family regulator/DNA-binding CsgD family transcriptional regulator